MKLLIWAIDPKRAAIILGTCLAACLPYALIRLGDWASCRFAIKTDGMGTKR